MSYKGVYEMEKTALSLMNVENQKHLSSIKVRDSWLLIPQNLFLFWIGKGENFLGVVDATSFLVDFLKEKQIENYSGQLVNNIKPFPYNTPLSQLYNHKQSVYPLLKTDGSFAGYLDRIQILDFLNEESSLKLSELEAVFTSAHNGIVSIDHNGIITAFNPAAEKMSGIPKEKAINQHLTDVMLPCGLLDVLSAGKGGVSIKYQVGKRKYITNRTPIIQQGKLIGAVGVFQEIGEIERISQELSTVKQLNKELSAILNSSYDGVIVTDTKGVVLKANKASERIIGLQESEMVNKPIDKLTEKDFFSKSLIEKACETGQPVTSSVATSKENALLITANPVSCEEVNVNRVLINVRDMTELNQLRHQLRYAKGLSDQYHYELTELKNKYLIEPGIIASSRKMKELINLAIRVANFDSSVLLLGESGVGKEVIAKLIHNSSGRSKHPFIKINCGAIPESILETELFGYDPGTFTGGIKDGKMGLFEVANKGTLLLDEIGDMPHNLQVKLLRVLQEREVMRVGSTRSCKIDVRIIASTNRDLQKLVDAGAFRQDLYFRLYVVPIRIPPLRERKEDIVPLILSLLKKLEKKYNLKKEFSPEAIDLFVSYCWPGNIRELENVVEQLFVICPEDIINLRHIPSHLFQKNHKQMAPVVVNQLIPMKEAIEELENQLIKKAMNDFGSTYKAAEALSVNQSTIWRKWKKIQETMESQQVMVNN